MLNNFRHVGIIVSNLEESCRFFVDVLGLEHHKTGFEQGKYIDNIVGLDRVYIDWIKLKTPDNFIVELLRYSSHPAMSSLKLPQVGAAHIAFTVDNIDQCYIKLCNNGYSCGKGPQLSVDGKARFMYCNGPDGVVVELVEEIDA